MQARFDDAGVAELADAQDSKSCGSVSQAAANIGGYGKSPPDLGVLLGALAAEIGPVAPDLADLLTAWPTLPDPVKAGIVAMVKAARSDSGRSDDPKGDEGVE